MGRLRMVTTGSIVGDFTADSPTLHVDSTNDRVGISTATPAVPLDVIGIAAFTTADGDNTQGVIRVGRDSGGAAGGELVWHTDDYVGLRCADSGALQLVVDVGGSVGIGTTTPAVPLDVIGIAAFTTADGDNTQGVIRVGRDSGGAAGGELIWHTDDYLGLRCADSGALSLVVDPSGNTGLGVVAPKTRLTVEGAVTLKEQAAADADTVAYGQLWVKDVTPCELYFTTDAGDDIQLTSGTAVAGGGGSSDTDTSTALAIELWMT